MMYSTDWTIYNNRAMGRCLVQMPNGDKLMQWRFDGRCWTKWQYSQSLHNYAKRRSHGIAFNGDIDTLHNNIATKKNELVPLNCDAKAINEALRRMKRIE